MPWYQALHGYNSANAGVTVRVVIGEGVTHISSYLCAPMNKICEDISLPSTLTSIGDYAFNWLERGLPETLVLSEQVEEIGTYAFNNCKGLKKVVIENPRVQLNNYAFYSARDLEEIVLPEGVTAIPKGFARSAPLKSIDLPDTVKTIGKESFLNCSSFTSIHWPAALESVGDGAFHSAGFTGNFTVPAGVTFGSEVFYFCEEITSLTLPAQGIKKAGSDLFRACSGLTHVTIPEGWTSMPISAFQNCTGLTSVSLPQSLTSIPGSAFSYCTALTSVELPEGLETIGGSAFMGCTALPALLIVPESVKTVGVSAYLESGVETIRFLGNAPTSVSDKGDYGSFPEECVLYYSPDKENWTTPQWHGYNTYAILGEGDYRFHDADYYSSLSLRSFAFRADVGPQIDHPVSSVTLTYQGNSISTTGDSSALSAAILQQEGEQISFTQSKMFDVSLPVEVLSTFNTIQFYPASGTYAVTKPFVQAVYARHDDGDYTDLLHSQLKFYAGSLTEETALYVQMNWNGHTPGKLYLSQTLDPADGVAVEEGFSDAGYLGLRLKAGQGLYLLMEYEGKVEAVAVGAAILSEDTSMKLNLGKSFGVEKPQDNFLFEFSFDVDLPLDTSMSLTVKNDGTVKALFGLELDKDSDEDAVFDTMQDYFEYEHQKENGLDLEGLKHLLKSRGAGVTLQRCSFVTSGSVNFLGCAEGHLVKYDNGQYGIVLSKGTVGLSFEGGVTQTFQMYAFSAPFYVSGSIKPKVTFNVTLYANEASEGLSLAPIDVKASIAIKIAGGLGWDSIASLGIYGKGSGELNFKVPFLEDTSSCTFQGSVGAEATVFSFSADLVIFEGEKIYLWGGDNAASVSLQALREAGWKPQSRDYLTGGSAGVSYAAVDGENTVLTAQTAVETIYPYASVQTAALPGGGQVAVWTEDPGRSVRPVDNNRTVLYYSYYDGSSWTAPAAVEAVDDGTADFNPVVRVMNGQVYVVWQDADRPLTAADTPDTIPAVIDLSCAVFDETTRTFTTLATVGTEYYDTTADLVWMEDGPAVVWTSNSSNQPMGGGAVCALHRQKIGAETAQTLADGLGVVDGLTAEGAQVWFSADTDGVADTFSDREIFHYDGAELRQLTDNAVADTKPARTGGTTVWYSGGVLQAVADTVTLQEDTDRYQYLRSAGGMEAVVYVTDG